MGSIENGVNVNAGDHKVTTLVIALFQCQYDATTCLMQIWTVR